MLTQNIRAIIFDCDGTLVDSEEAHYQGWQHALRKHQESLSIEEYIKLIGHPVQKIVQFLSSKIKNDCGEQLLLDKRMHHQMSQGDGLPSIEATVQFVHHLALHKERLNFKMGVASASRKQEILNHLHSLNIEHYFDIILSGEQDLQDYHDLEGTNKPKPYIYLHAAKLLGVHPSECVVIEDSHAGVTSGVMAGCFTIAVPNHFTKDHDFSKAKLILKSFAGINVDDFFQMIVKDSKNSD